MSSNNISSKSVNHSKTPEKMQSSNQSQSISSLKSDKSNDNSMKESLKSKENNQNSAVIVINLTNETPESIEKNDKKNKNKTTNESKIEPKKNSLESALNEAHKGQDRSKLKERRKRVSAQNVRVRVLKPKRRLEPIASIDRLFGSHLRTRVTDKSAVKPQEEVKAKVTAEDNTQTSLTPEKTVNMDQEIDHIVKGISEWMTIKYKEKRPKDKVMEGLECIAKLRKFYIYDNIKMIDRLYNINNWTTNSLTIRNADYQQLFWVGCETNKRNGRFRSFTLRVLDQYCRHIITIKKYFKCIFCGLLSVDIECPPRVLIGRMRQTRFYFSSTLEFVIFEPKTMKRLYIIRRLADSVIRHEFDILNATNDSFGSILKRFEKIDLNKTVKEDHFVRVSVPQVTIPKDKALLLSAGIIVNIFYLRKFRL